MKIGLVLVTIFLLITFDLPSAQALTVDTILQHYLNHQHALTTIIRRKRDKPTGPNSTLGKLSNGTSGSSDEEGRCMLQCITPMSAMANNVTSPQYNANFAVCPKYDPKVMDGMCSIYTQVKSCLAQCPQSPMVQGIMQNAFQILDFICVEKKDDLKKYGPCLSEVCDQIKKQCEPKCGSINETLGELMKMGEQARSSPSTSSTGSSSNLSSMLQLMGKTCKLATCTNSCSQELITKNCSAGAHQLQTGMMATLLNSTTNMMSSLGMAESWPKECKPTELLQSNGKQNEQQNGVSSGKCPRVKTAGDWVCTAHTPRIVKMGNHFL